MRFQMGDIVRTSQSMIGHCRYNPSFGTIKEVDFLYGDPDDLIVIEWDNDSGVDLYKECELKLYRRP